MEMLKAAKEAAVEGGRSVLEFRKNKLEVTVKSNISDIVTKADEKSEKLILEKIRENFPDHSILSEEAGLQDNDSEYEWIVDPLDGTMPYSSGLPIYAVSVGLFKNGKPYLGAIYLPELDSLYWGKVGDASYLNGDRIGVSTNKKLTSSLVGFEFGYSTGKIYDVLNMIRGFPGKIRYTPSFGCTSASLCFLAEGSLDGYFHTAWIWDFAAGAAIVEAAGGKLTNYSGGEVDWESEKFEVLASNKKLHKDLVKLIEL